MTKVTRWVRRGRAASAIGIDVVSTTIAFATFVIASRKEIRRA